MGLFSNWRAERVEERRHKELLAVGTRANRIQVATLVVAVGSLIGLGIAIGSLFVAQKALDEARLSRLEAKAARPDPPTQVYVFSEPDPVVISAVMTGTCDVPSLTVRRVDARRCFTTESLVIDPCFVGIGEVKRLVCPHDVFSRPPRAYAVVDRDLAPLPPDVYKRLRIPRPDVQSEDPATRWPWAFQLGDGRKCGSLRDAGRGSAGGQIVNYGCSAGSEVSSDFEDEGAVIGAIDRSGSTWYVYARSGDGLGYERVRMAIAWF